MAEVAGLQDFTAQLFADLREGGARFAVVGGFAVSVRAEPRFTHDIDVAVAVRTDAEAEALVLHLQTRGYQVFMVLEHEVTGRMATVRVRKAGRKGEPLIADLLFASSGIEAELVDAATSELLPGVGEVPVATCGFLLALKLLSRREKGRPNDAADVSALLAVASEDDIAQARAAVALIEERGFNRQRNLRQLLDEALVDRGGDSA
jgi:hypothetical protein